MTQSVTGVGPGSAEGASKGRREFTLGVERLIGPRVVMTGVATLVAGTLTVDGLPALPNTGHLPSASLTDDYMVFVTNTSNENAIKAVLTVSSTATTIVIDGTGTDVINWMIVKTGSAF